MICLILRQDSFFVVILNRNWMNLNLDHICLPVRGSYFQQQCTCIVLDNYNYHPSVHCVPYIQNYYSTFLNLFCKNEKNITSPL